jgi:hypothetical protein
MTDPNKVFQQFAEQVAADFPELREILDQAKAGTITEEDAMRCLSEVVMSNPELARRFQQMAMVALTPLRAEDMAEPLEHGGLLLHRKTGLPRLNPLVEAALAERAQFDGDIPELRTGGMPAGVKPAVSVDTDVRNPVALGRMLNEASDQVASKIAAKEPERQQLVADLALLDLVEGAGTALAVQAERDLVFQGKSDALDVAEYRRGQVPAPVVVTQPSGSLLLALSPEERKQSAWTFLSTTQGRRSAVKGVVELIEVKLKGAGFDVSVRPFSPDAKGTVLAAHEWSVGIDGPGAVQSAFSLIDIAAAAITRGLLQGVGEQRGKVTLEVTAVNTVDIRAVGWAGRLMSHELALPGGDA